MSQSPRRNEPSEQVPPLLEPAIPFMTRVSYFIQLWLFKLLVTGGLSLRPLLRPSLPSYPPTRKKTYPCRPHLENRVFIPESYKAGELLPLYLDIHGGGFALCAPVIDDEICSLISNRHKFVVVSVNYSKTPSFAFPAPTYDVAAISQAVIDDDSLPIDKSRVAIGGFSAGGNLALSATQLPELQGKIRAAVAIVPVTNFTISTAEKRKSKPSKSPNDKDMLDWMASLFNYGYFPPGQDLRDPLLSVALAPREILPQWIFTIAAEYDMLSNEAREMMYRLAEVNDPTEKEKYAFERGKYKWELVRGVEHSFTHGKLEVGENEKKRILLRDNIIAEIGEWLMKGPFTR